MVIVSPVEELASSPPLAADAAVRASQPQASNPVPESLFDDQGTTAWSSHPPPYASTATTSSGFNPSSSTTPLSLMDTFFTQSPPGACIMWPVIAEPSFYNYAPQTQCAIPPVPVPMQTTPPMLVQTTSVEPSYYRQQQRTASAAAEALIFHEDPDAHRAQESTKLAPRKTAAAKPVFKPPKRAAARSNRAASPRTASVADPGTMAGQVQVQEPEQAGSVVAVAAADQIAPYTNSMALLCQEQWQLQSACSNSLGAGDQATAVVGQEVMMGPYADTSPSGVRFKPTDEELIFYLRLKHAGVQKMPVDFFKEVDVYHVHPETTKG
ncbi:hypothetical protein BAE44_0025343, partial [Dichanthelium oligosanthes]